MYQYQVRKRTLQPVYGGPTAVASAVVHDPEYLVGRGVRLCAHHLLDQPAERFNPGGRLTTTKEFGTVDIPRGQVS